MPLDISLHPLASTAEVLREETDKNGHGYLLMERMAVPSGVQKSPQDNPISTNIFVFRFAAKGESNE